MIGARSPASRAGSWQVSGKKSAESREAERVNAELGVFRLSEGNTLCQTKVREAREKLEFGNYIY